MTNYYEVLEFLDKAWETRCSDILQMNAQANNLLDHKKYEKAILYFDKIKQTCEVGPEFWLIKGTSLYKLGRFEEAEECLEEGLNEYQLDPHLQYEKAKTLLRLGKKEECMVLLQKCCLLDTKLKLRVSKDPEFAEMMKSDISQFL